jgi:hypothetical protein
LLVWWLLRRQRPGPHGDGARPQVVEGLPSWSATPSANADTRGGVAESWATTTTLVLALTLPFALAFVGVGRRGGGWGDSPMGT